MLFSRYKTTVIEYIPRWSIGEVNRMTDSILLQIRTYLKDGGELKLKDAQGTDTEDITEAKTVSLKDSVEFSLDEPTEFTISDAKVDLRVIVHCWIHKDSSAADYLADCEKRQLTNVSFLQRTDLINWLSGASDTSQYILGEGETTSTTGDKQATGGNDHANAGATMADDPELAKIVSHERSFLDHNSSLRGSKPIEFGYLIKDAELKLVQSIKSSLKGKGSGKSSSSGTHGINKNGSGRPGSVAIKDPIILIPSAASSIFTINNIKKFLQDSEYVHPQQISISQQNDLVTVEKKFDRLTKPVRFIVVNNTRMFTKPEYWDRVVAVFTTGHTWQFNTYQWNTPQELFQHCKGYYFHFDGDSVPHHVQQWNVEKVELDKNKRFKDVEVARYFWNSLEKELIVRGFR